MITYKATFIGRTAGAIGIRYQITTEVSGADPDAARLALYDRFEHISGLTLTRIPLPAITQPTYTDCPNCGTTDHNWLPCPCECHEEPL